MADSDSDARARAESFESRVSLLNTKLDAMQANMSAHFTNVRLWRCNERALHLLDHGPLPVRLLNKIKAPLHNTGLALEKAKILLDACSDKDVEYIRQLFKVPEVRVARGSAASVRDLTQDAIINKLHAHPIGEVGTIPLPGQGESTNALGNPTISNCKPDGSSSSKPVFDWSNLTHADVYNISHRDLAALALYYQYDFNIQHNEPHKTRINKFVDWLLGFQ